MPQSSNAAALLLSAGVLPSRLATAQHDWELVSSRDDRYWPHFFSPAEFGVLSEIATLVLTGDRPKGLQAAALLDLAAANSAKHVQSAWRDHIERFQEFCRAWFGGEFANLTPAEKAEILTAAEQEADATVSQIGHFFRAVKAMAQKMTLPEQGHASSNGASITQDLAALRDRVEELSRKSAQSASRPLVNRASAV